MARNQTSWGTIGNAIKRLLKPPVFEDEEKTRIAMILGIILWAVVAVVGTMVITWILTGRSHDLGPYAFAANSLIILFAITLLSLIRGGYVKAAAFTLVIFLWANITFQAITSDGVRGSVAIIYLTIMVLAGLLLDWRSSVGIGILSALSIWLLANAEKIGYMRYFRNKSVRTGTQKASGSTAPVAEDESDRHAGRGNRPRF